MLPGSGHTARLEQAQRAGLDTVKSKKGIKNVRSEIAKQDIDSCFLRYCQHWPNL